jgi:iron complex outermembrane receptor protein
VINQDMGIPLVQKFDLDVSGRWDHYDSFGNTQNPKISFSWILFDGFQARGSMGSSFTAPVVTNLPSGFGPRSVANNNNGGATVPATHVNAPGSWCAAGCVLDAAHPGITLGGANDNQPATGLTYSAGFDWDVGTTLSPLNSFFDILNGLNVSVTYWQAKSLGLMTTPTIVNEANVPGLQNQLQLAPPGGWTPTSPEVLAAIAGATPPTTPLNPTIWFIYRNILQNAFNIQANGIDFDVRYRLPTDDFGTFTFGINGAELLRFDENNGKSTDGNWTSFLNGYQVNTTFSSLQFHARATFGWSMDPFSADIAVNFTNPYWNTQAGNPNVPVPGKTTTPTQKIEANYTIDANFSYNVPEDLFPGWTNGLQIFVNSQNVFDEKPPFYNATLYTGYDSGNSSPLGRIVNIGFRKKW